MSYSLPNGDITFSSGEILTSDKMNKLAENQSDIADFLDALNVIVYDATLTIQKNGTTVQTFTANSNTNKTANITVPTTVAELSDEGNYARTNAIPTVYDSALSITMAGVTLGTFTANQSAAGTINIPVDDALDSTSSHPVENRVIAGAIFELNETLGELESALVAINGDNES